MAALAEPEPIAGPPTTETGEAPVDICLIVEGAYPYIAGGVSTWLDWLIRNQPDRTFGVLAVTADDAPRRSKYQMPDNVGWLRPLPLRRLDPPSRLAKPRLDRGRLSAYVTEVFASGDLAAFAELLDLLDRPVRIDPLGRFRAPRRATADEILQSGVFWDVMLDCFERLAPSAAFADLFWAWRTLAGGMLAALTEPVPAARCYHAISTGYAGLVGARASLETGAPFLITEHGIYTNERRIDLMMAGWVRDTIAKGYLPGDARNDARDVWINTFESFARIAYAAAARVTTLYSGNQSFQLALGARPDRLEVIPNGIDIARFSGLPRESAERPPTVALIGRVVPIKDVEAFIRAAARVRRDVPDLQALIMGPTDEDENYYRRCEAIIADLGLEETVSFLGQVKIAEWLPRLDLIALTSISEAQPLVLLEAGAAGVPCVATDVGSCREIIEGAPGEDPPLGPGGRCVAPMAVDQIADAMTELLKDGGLRAQCGATLKARVEHFFTSDMSAARYAALYAGVIE